MGVQREKVENKEERQQQTGSEEIVVKKEIHFNEIKIPWQYLFSV